MALNFLIIGSGYIGGYLATKLPNAKLIQGYIESADVLKNLLLKEYPSHVLINCSGKTGKPNVDWCEDHKDVVFGANVGIPTMIAELCYEIKQYWIHIGSGCIYDGYDQDYTEEDVPDFDGSFYARTKKWSQDILEGFSECCVLRIRMPIDEYMGDRSLISKLLKYTYAGKPICSLPNSMTYLADLVEAIKFLAEKGHTGTWNVVNKGSMTNEEILEMYKKWVYKDLKYEIISYEALAKTLKAGRSNCILSTKKLEDEGFVMPNIRDRIEAMLIAEGKKRLDGSQKKGGSL